MTDPKTALPNFHSDGPVKATCYTCARPYTEWMTEDATWNLLPGHLHATTLCVRCFKRVLVEGGHDPDAVVINRRPWQYMQQQWRLSKKVPAHHTKIMIKYHCDWCEVQEVLGPNTYKVRLALTGDECAATWDGETYQRLTGRPLLTLIDHPKCSTNIRRIEDKYV